MKEGKKREGWADFVKGLGILTVVLGHSGNTILHHYFFWFHMPIFFIISGYFFKPLNQMSDLKPYVQKKAKHFLIPYIFFGMFIAIIMNFLQWINGNASLYTIVKEVAGLLYGGRAANGSYGVFWFVTCLFITQVAFALVLLKIKSGKKILGVLFVCYLIACLESFLAGKIDLRLPWNFDVAFLAIVYFAVGYYLKQGNLLNKIKWNRILVPSSIFFIAAIVVGEKFGLVKYKLDLKYHVYNHPILDLLIPIGISYLFIYLCFHLYQKVNPDNRLLRVVETIGMSSLTIMYLHIPINDGIRLFVPYGWILFFIIGFIVPFLLDRYVLRRNNFSRFAFLGENTFNFVTKSPKKTAAPLP